MTIDENAQKDLELSSSDAGNVLGGRMLLSKLKKLAPKKHAKAHAGPNVDVTFTPASVSSDPPESDCGPDDSDGAAQ